MEGKKGKKKTIEIRRTSAVVYFNIDMPTYARICMSANPWPNDSYRQKTHSNIFAIKLHGNYDTEQRAILASSMKLQYTLNTNTNTHVYFQPRKSAKNWFPLQNSKCLPENLNIQDQQILKNLLLFTKKKYSAAAAMISEHFIR